MVQLAVCLILAFVSAQAAWKAGAASVDITPTESIWLAGYGARDKPSESVRGPLYAKALALQDDSGAVSVMVTLDLIGMRPRWTDPVTIKVRDRLHVAPERLIYNASHTHSGPVIDHPGTYRDKMGARVDHHSQVIQRYTKSLQDKLYSVIEQAIGSLAPATLKFEQGFAGFAVNRRRVGRREFPGPVDHDVPVLGIRNAAGNVTAILFGYACHNTIMGDYTIHGDYAGYAEAALQQRFPASVALFVQGAGADANPLPRRRAEHLERYGTTLTDAVEEVLRGKMRPVNGPLRAAAETIELALNPEGTHPYPVQAWRFADSLTLLALGGELTVDYALRFKAKYGWNQLWVAGYSNDVFAYIPSLRVLREGGYEAQGVLVANARRPFAEDVEERIAAAVDRVMRKLQ